MWFFQLTKWSPNATPWPQPAYPHCACTSSALMCMHFQLFFQVGLLAIFASMPLCKPFYHHHPSLILQNPIHPSRAFSGYIFHRNFSDLPSRWLSPLKTTTLGLYPMDVGCDWYPLLFSSRARTMPCLYKCLVSQTQ